MTLPVGSKLGPYEILAPLGAGGMGEVYRARDPRLGRDVAIKILPEKLAGDPAALARFEREAKAVAALSHQNVLGIFDLGRDGGTAYAVMELLVGQTLRERLVEGPLPLRKALEYGQQIATGLAAAHEKGIVHRDLKPENLFLTSDGRVKILDFGLARVVPAEPEDTQSPTAAAGTEPGTIMGTVGYMSPEQVRGKPADARSDIFSLGSVLYEMLSGERAFLGDSAAETMAAIAQKDPPSLSESSGRFPPHVERILRHCLEKRPEDRFDTAHDLVFALETATGGASTPHLSEAASNNRPIWKWLLGVAGVLAAIAVAGLLAARLRAPEPPRFRQLTYHRGYIETARFAPDGQTVIFGSTRRDEPLRLYSTRLDSVESRPLDLPAGSTVLGVSRTGDMAVLLHSAHHGFWIRSGTLGRVALGGGAPREILEHVTDADISPDGKDFAVVREIVGKRQRLEFPVGKVVLETYGWMSYPRISADGAHVAFFEHPQYGNDDGFLVVATRGGPPRRQTAEWQGLRGLAWSRDGREIWFTAGPEGAEAPANGSRYELFALRPGGRARLVYGPPMDLRIHDISSNGAVLLTGEDDRVEVGGFLQGDAKERDLSIWSNEAVSGVAQDGSAYVGLEQSAPGAGLEPIFYFRRASESAPVRLGNGTAIGMSPDGRWVLGQVGVSRGASTPLTLFPTGPGDPRPLPLGKVTARPVVQEFASWSADGSKLLFVGSEGDRPRRAWLLDLRSPGPPRPVTPEGSSLAVLSPDGGSVAAVDSEGKLSVYSVSDGKASDVRGVLPGEIPLEWDASGKVLFVWDRTWPARISRLDLASGNRTFWKELAADPLGLLYGNVILARDGQHYVYRLRRVLSQLNVAEGLK